MTSTRKDKASRNACQASRNACQASRNACQANRNACIKGTSDEKRWLIELKNRGIEKFMLKDLPEDLKNKKLLQKSRASGLIEQIRKIDDRAIWRIL